MLAARSARRPPPGGIVGRMAGRLGTWLSPLSWARWEVLSYTAILLVAAALRFWELGVRASHHDESLHAYYSWLLAEGRGFQHNPLMHGPFQFEATALVFKLFGDSDATSRLLPALVGTLLVATPLLFRRYLGRTGALATLLLLAFSPTILYFSRFTRNEVYVLLWDLLLIFAVFRFMQERKARYLYLAAAAIALGVATKEVFFITLFIVASFLFLLSLRDLWLWLRRRIPRLQVTPAATMLVLVVTLTLPQGASALGLAQERLGLTLLNQDWSQGPVGVPISRGPGLTDDLLGGIQDAQLRFQGFQPQGRSSPLAHLRSPKAGELVLGGVALQGLDVAIGFTLLLIALSTAVGLWWGGWRWALAALVFWAIYLTLFTTFFTNVAGIGSGLWQSLGYWIAQHDVRRGGQPWYYYLLLLPTYEFLPLLFGLGLGVWFLLRDRLLEAGQRLFTFFLLYWTLLAFLLYSWAGEKMPWLSVHLALPLILASGVALGRLVEGVSWQVPRRVLLRGSWRPLAALGVAAFLFVFTVRAAFLASYEHSDVPKEMLIYTQTSPAVPELRDRIEAFGAATGQGRAVPILLDTSDAYGWPWYWYLRRHTAVRYVDLNSTTVEAAGAVLILKDGNEGKVTGLDARYYPPEPFPFRQWFPEAYRGSGYNGLTPEEVWEGLRDPKAWGAVWRYWMHRQPPQPLGSTNALAYFPRPPSTLAPASPGT